MPKEDIPGSKLAIHVVKQKKLKRPLSDQANILKTHITKAIRRINDIKSFSRKELINNHCDQLEIDVIVAVESAHNSNLNARWLFVQIGLILLQIRT